VAMLSTELATKRLDLLRQLAPDARRVVFIVNLDNPVSALQVKPLEAAARTLGIQLYTHNARNAREIDATLQAIPWKAMDGVLIGGDTVLFTQGSKIAQAVRKARLPAVFSSRQYHEYGVIMSYGADSRELMRRGAYYVDRILKGAKPSDLPIEQISKIDLIIDLRVAREQGIKVPEELLYRADANAAGDWSSLLCCQPSACEGRVHSRRRFLLVPAAEALEPRRKDSDTSDLLAERGRAPRRSHVLRTGAG